MRSNSTVYNAVSSHPPLSTPGAHDVTTYPSGPKYAVYPTLNAIIDDPLDDPDLIEMLEIEALEKQALSQVASYPISYF